MGALGAMLLVTAVTLAGSSSPAAAAQVDVMVQLGGELGHSFLHDDAVGMSGDGNTVVVAQYKTPEDRVDGVWTSVRVLDWNGSKWVQRGVEITGVSASREYIAWGSGVAVDADGGTVAISASGDDTHGTGTGLHVAGTARVFDWSGSAWVQRGADLVGHVSLDDMEEIQLSGDGNTVVTGSSGLASNEFGDAEGVQVHRWDGAEWVRHGTLYYGDYHDGLWGNQVDVNADGTVIVTTDPSQNGIADEVGIGRVTVWVLDPVTGRYERRGPPTSGTQGLTFLGWDVALDAGGTSFIAGTDDSYALVMEWNGTEWVQRGSRIEAQPGDPPFWGHEVTMSGDGDTVVVSAPREVLAFDADGPLPPGPTVARIYDWDATGADWVQRGSDFWGTAEGPSIGRSLDADADGDTVIMGDFYGPARVYRLMTVETPAVPTAVAATAGDGTATVSWTPGSSGGAPIVATTIEQQADGAADWVPAEVGGVDPSGTTVTGLANGTGYRFRVSVANQELSSEPSLPSNLVVPSAPPIATITTLSLLTNAAEIGFTVTFDQPLTTMVTDVVVTGTAGGAVTGATPSADGFTVTVGGMAADGTVTVTVPASTGVNANGQGNAESQVTVQYDATAPVVTVTADGPTPTNTLPAGFTVTASEPLAGFGAPALVLTGIDEAAASVVVSPTADPLVHTVSVDASAVADGVITLELPAGSARDAAGNVTTAAASASVVYDATIPETASVELAPGQAASTSALPVVFEIDFPEAPVGFDVDDLVVGGTGGATVASLTGGPDTWTVTVDTVVDDGTITLHIPAGAYTDTAGNPSPATATASVTYDTTAPVVLVPSLGVTTRTDAGEPGAVVEFEATASDGAEAVGVSVPAGGAGVAAALLAIPSPTVDCSPSSGSFFGIGSTSVECSAADAAGNVGSASFVVEVVDDEPPVIDAMDDVVLVLAAGATSGAADYPAPAATDNSGTATVTCDVPAGPDLPVGSHTVTCTAVDPAGNTASTSFRLLLVAATPPAPSTAPSSVSGSLPYTGADSTNPVRLGLVALAGGALLVGAAHLSSVARRRRRTG